MLFQSSANTIGIDLRDSEIKIVEMDTRAKLPKILNYHTSTLSTENRDERALQVRKIIEEKGFSARKTNIAFSSSSVLHKTITLPHMSKREMKAVLKREAKKEASSISGEIVYDSLILGSVVEKGIEKNNILLVIAPQDEANEILSFWKEVGLEPQLLTTVSLALLGSLKTTSSEWENEVTAFLYLGALQTFMIISDRGKLEFSRDFMLSKRECEESSLDLPDSEYVNRLTMEINRSFLYYKHQFRGKVVKKTILAGEIENLNVIKDSLNEGVDQDVDVFLPTQHLDTTNLGENQKAFQELLPSMAISLGLCLKDMRKTKINLMPAEVVEKKQIFARKLAFCTSTSIILLLLLFGYLFLFLSVKNHQRILFRQQVFWREIAPMVNKLTKVERERELYQSRLFVLENFKSTDLLWQDMLKSLSLMVPDEMLLHFLQAKKEGEVYQVDIKGEVVSDSAASTQAVFNQFYHDLEHYSFFKTINPPSIKLNPYVETLGAIPGSSNINLNWIKKREGRLEGRNLNKLTFEISGECGEG